MGDLIVSRNIALVVMIGAFSSIGFAYADNMFPNTDSIFDDCYKKIESDARLVDCMDNKYKKIDIVRKKLTLDLLSSLKNQKMISSKKFYESNKEWIFYRDSECDIESNSTFGTVGGQYGYKCLVGLDIQRIDQIKFLIDQTKNVIKDNKYLSNKRIYKK